MKGQAQIKGRLAAKAEHYPVRFFAGNYFGNT